MAHFEKKEYAPGAILYEITDDNGRTSQLTAEQALHLLEWLHRQRSELARLVNRPNQEHTPGEQEHVDYWTY